MSQLLEDVLHHLQRYYSQDFRAPSTYNCFSEFHYSPSQFAACDQAYEKKASAARQSAALKFEFLRLSLEHCLETGGSRDQCLSQGKAIGIEIVDCINRSEFVNQ